jgi:hypothetical protein
VRALAEPPAGLPLHVYRRTETGKERATDHPLYDLLHTAPEVLNMRANRTAAAVPVAPRTELMRQSSPRVAWVERDPEVDDLVDSWGGVEEFAGYLTEYEDGTVLTGKA